MGSGNSVLQACDCSHEHDWQGAPASARGRLRASTGRSAEEEAHQLVKGSNESEIRRGNLFCYLCQKSLNRSEELLKVPCAHNHLFHAQCIKPWLATNTTCPIDGQDLRKPRSNVQVASPAAFGTRSQLKSHKEQRQQAQQHIVVDNKIQAKSEDPGFAPSTASVEAARTAALAAENTALAVRLLHFRAPEQPPKSSVGVSFVDAAGVVAPTYSSGSGLVPTRAVSPVSSSSFNGEDQPDVLAATFPPRQPSTNYDERLPDGKQFEGSLPSSANMWLQVENSRYDRNPGMRGFSSFQGAPRGYTLARIQQSENFGSHSGDSMKLYETNEDFYTLTHTHQSKKIDEASEDFSKLGWASYQSARLFGPKATGTGESSINANDLQIPIIHDTVCI